MTEVKGKVTTTQIKPCGCNNAFQDGLYGIGNRAKNSTANGFRCTVCGKVD